MQTKTATNPTNKFPHDNNLFSDDKNLMNESTLATLLAISTLIALLFFGFNI